MRRFNDGDLFQFHGAMFRIVKGKKSADDLRLDMWLGTRTEGQWVPVKASWLFLMSDFIYENEDALYPPGGRRRGGEKFMDALREAVDHGWVAATQTLEEERRNAAERRSA